MLSNDIQAKRARIKRYNDTARMNREIRMMRRAAERYILISLLIVQDLMVLHIEERYNYRNYNWCVRLQVRMLLMHQRRPITPPQRHLFHLETVSVFMFLDLVDVETHLPNLPMRK